MENMEQEFEQTPENEPVTEPQSPREDYDSPAADAVSYEQPYVAQKIHIPPVAPTPEDRANRRGMRVFCLILTLVILFSGCAAGGYYLGRQSMAPRNYFSDTTLELAGKPDNADQLSESAIYSAVNPSVVGVLVYNEAGKMGAASGVIYTADGYIITNDHIYSSIPSASFKIFTYDGKEYNADYVAGDTRSDLAVLKITDSVTLTSAVFGDSQQVVPGEAVCAIGHPNGYSTAATITRGIVSAPKVRMSITSNYSSNFIQTDTAINPGSSGGVLCNMYGQVVGVTSSKIVATGYEGNSFAIPTKTVKRVVESLLANGHVKDRARLGITYRFYNSAMAELQNLSAHGLQIDSVDKESALFGKISEGDIITRVNDLEINDDDIILDIIEDSAPGDTIELTVQRAQGGTDVIRAVLLADEGSSSYSTEAPGDSSQTDNGGTFNFPEGY